MKSKSFDLKKSPAGKDRGNKTFDFVGLYKSAAETNEKLLQNPKTVENLDKENSFNSSTATAKREKSPSKKNKKSKNEVLEISYINIDGRNLKASGRTSPVNGSRATSTPNVDRKPKSADQKVKSIMKTSTATSDETMEEYSYATPTSKPKKRNKSVSFMLDDTEEIAIKKTKSDDSLKDKKSEKNKAKANKAEERKAKKLKKQFQAEKENQSNIRMETDQNTEVPNKKNKNKHEKSKTVAEPNGDSASDTQVDGQEKKKKLKKFKKLKKAEETSEPVENYEKEAEDEVDQKPKKLKKKKRSAKSTMEDGEEPVTKLKKEVPDVIAEDLENLTIGDNAHTLTNLLDEMVVVEKDQKKKNKLHRKKNKAKKTSVSSSENADLEKIEEGKEKVKWKNRKWNKDKKDMTDLLATSVIIENLPLKIMCSYKKSLADHFGPCGLIRRIGIAEMYPTEEPKPVFTTTINFYSEGAASKALEEDNTTFEGSRIRVKKPLPATQTTIVVRSYAELTEQNLSSVFTGAGRIRNIRQPVKGKKAIGTAFIEFDGPESVERALKMAEDAKIGGKKIHVSKFELRGKNKKQQKAKVNQDSENEGDSEDSND